MRKLSIPAIVLLFCFSAKAVTLQPQAGCLDCFNFAAPTISGAESIASPEIGLIVLDSYYNGFRGYNSYGLWTKLSNEKSVRSFTASGTVVVQDDLVKADATSAAITLNLPAAAALPGKTLIVKKTDTSANPVTIHPYSTETIDGVSTRVLTFKNEIVQITSDGTSWQDITTQKIIKAPTVQRFTSSSGTYTTPSGVVYIQVELSGGGGGSGGSGSAGGSSGGTGGTTTFGSSLLTAVGGSGGVAGTAGGTGGAGGTVTVSSPAISVIATVGGTGGGASGNSASTAVALSGGAGGNNNFGGGAGQGPGAAAGVAGATNTGGGASGGGTPNTVSTSSGGGGGAGGYIKAIIASPSATYSYAVGGTGSAGSGGTSGQAGALGGSGVIIVTEYYQ